LWTAAIEEVVGATVKMAVGGGDAASIAGDRWGGGWGWRGRSHQAEEESSQQGGGWVGGKEEDG
jgi:hypothetical protein